MDYRSDERFSLSVETLCDEWLAVDEAARDEKTKAVLRLATDLARDHRTTVKRIRDDISAAAFGRMHINAGIAFRVSWREHTLYSVDGGVCDEEPNSDPEECIKDFSNHKEAIGWTKAHAAKSKLGICTDTHYGNGSITRNVYEIWSSFYDEEYADWVDCTCEGKPCDPVEAIEVVDALDLHPEVKEAWRRANRSYCNWFDYVDDGGLLGFGYALEKELGEDWDELDYIRRI